MRILLIGMSGSGKSYWSKKLKEKGFTHFCIDDLLEEKLEIGLKQLGYTGINDLSKWMRQPYDVRYARTSSTYLEYEKKTMLEVFSLLEAQKKRNDNIVVDTTGSVIYTGKDILQKLSQLTTVVYFETPQSVQRKMYELYIKDPKPVYWGKSFSQKKGETAREALARCYPKLLAYRTAHYKKLAQVTFDYETLHDKAFTVDDFLKRIQSPHDLSAGSK